MRKGKRRKLERKLAKYQGKYDALHAIIEGTKKISIWQQESLKISIWQQESLIKYNGKIAKLQHILEEK